MKRKILKVVIFILLSTGFSSLAADKGPLKVFVSIVPQKYFVEKLSGDLTDVSVMVQPGASPEFYEPKPRQMTALAQAGIYFAIGVPFEDVWLKRIEAANRQMLVVKTQEGIKKIPMATHFDAKEDARRGLGHDHGVLDPHVWLSPPLVIIQAGNILKGLQKRDPNHASLYEAHYKIFIKEIATLDSEIKEIFRGKEGNRFMVFHPAWGYFARAYGLEQIPVEIEGKAPKAAQLHDLIVTAQKHGVKAIVSQPESSSRSAEVIARAIGGKVVLVSPLAPEWEKNLKEVAVKLKEALW